MKRFLCILLCLGLMPSLGACGKKAEETPAAPEETAAELTGDVATDSAGFADAYLTYVDIAGALSSEVSDRISLSNSLLESAKPDGYYMDPGYLLLVYAPFSAVYPAMVADAVLKGSWEGATLSEEGNLFRADFVYVDKSSGEAVDREGRCTWEFNDAGAFRVSAFVDGQLLEFTEFVPLGGDRYLLYTLTDKAVVTYADGTVTALRHVQRICEDGVDAFAGDVRYFDPGTEDYYPDGGLTPDELTLDDDALFLITLENDTMTYAGKVGQDILTEDGLLADISWVTIDPIVLLK